jgi:hypothetical protein
MRSKQTNTERMERMNHWLKLCFAAQLTIAGDD